MAGERRDREHALALLGLTATATPAQITGAYRRLAQATHPDRCPDADASERFAAVTDAYRSALNSASQPSTAPERSAPRRAPFWIDAASEHLQAETLVVGPVYYVPWTRKHESDAAEA